MGDGSDWAVIMARGQSRRLGFPKGAATLGPGGKPLLTLVEELYRQLDFCRLVVTVPELEDNYGALLAGGPGLMMVTWPEGGDTALTLRAAWNRLNTRRHPPRLSNPLQRPAGSW